MTRRAALLLFLILIWLAPLEVPRQDRGDASTNRGADGRTRGCGQGPSGLSARGALLWLSLTRTASASLKMFPRAFVNLKPGDNLTIGDELSDNEVQTLLGVYGTGLPWKPVASGNHSWLRSDGKVAATYQDEQTPVRSHMTPQEETAIRKTPSLLVSDVAFAAASKRQQDAQEAQQAAQKKQGRGEQDCQRVRPDHHTAASNADPATRPTTALPTTGAHYPHPGSQQGPRVVR